MPVIDSSVLVAYFGDSESAEQAGELIAAKGDDLFAPHLIDAEVGNGLRRLVARRELDPDVAGASLADLAELPLIRSPHTPLLDAAWELRANVSFYDALYLALAQELELTLITLDARLVRGATKLGMDVELLGER